MAERIICNGNGGELREEIVRKEGEGMSMLTEQTERLRKTADKLRSVHVDDRDVGTLFAVMGELREAADTIEGLRQKAEDLEGMLGELPPEGKCAMLLVKQVDGEYIWGCELYDFASYCLVDSEADTYTGMTLNDPFGRADFADKLTMAKELRRMAASLEAQGDVLGIVPNDGTRWHELFGTPERAVKTVVYMFGCKDFMPWVACKECPILGACELRHCDHDALLEWLKQEVDA